ncbi:MAG: endonuclease/exonuclease/phosphatase family protein [Bacteroidaceae bacterium]|nr:endonuclease/exonuclease/phosphatase family protein [Bacteroidaceae bacterium]
MKKLSLLIFSLLAVLCANTSQAQSRKLSCYSIGFYNQENLFDTQHDEGKNDYEFLPDGSYGWTEMKYSHKLKNMSTVLSEMGTDKLPGIGCAVIGVSEVENAHVMADLVAQPALAARNFKFVHIEGPDKRGVDCAFIYNPSLFRPAKVWLQPYLHVDPQDDIDHPTRGFLTMQGHLLDANQQPLTDAPLTLIVCHWPSRAAGSPLREQGGKLVRQMTDSIRKADPAQRIMVMGDMNDDPDNISMKTCLGAKRKMSQVGEGDFFNPWWDTLKKGTGTLAWDGAWNLFDQIVLSRNLLNVNGEKDYTDLKFLNHQIFRRDYLFQTAGKYRGNPKRTHAGGEWLDGYSDHLPVVVYLVKEIK